MHVTAVVVRRIDVEIRRAADAAGQVSKDRGGRIAAPVSVPNVINVGCIQNQRTAVIADTVAARPRSGLGLAWMGVFVFLLVIVVAQSMNDLFLVRKFGLAALRKSDTENGNQHEHAKSRESGDKSLHLLGSS